MKFMKKLIVTAFIIVLIAAVVDLPSIGNPCMAQAAAIKISNKTLSMEIAQTKSLKVTGTKKTVKWSSSNKKIAAVTSKGKVKAIAAGKTSITASVAGKKLVCKVTVKQNTLVKNAPFTAKEVTIDQLHIIIPSDWTVPSKSNTSGKLSSGLNVTLVPEDSDVASEFDFTVTKLSKEDLKKYSDYEAFKADIADYMTKDSFNTAFTKTFDTDFEFTHFEQTDMETSFGKVYRTEILLNVSGQSVNVIVYDFITGNYNIYLTAIDASQTELNAVSDYLVGSITVK